MISERRYRTAASLVFLLSLSLIGHAQSRDDRSGAGNGGGPVEVQMRNILYHFTDSVAVHIRKLYGKLAPIKAGIPIFDDKNSFTLQITAAEIAMSPDSLANVLNSYVFAKDDAPLKGISIRIERGRLKVKGKLHSKGDIAFETEGRLSATADGKIRLHTEKMKALHLPVKGLMDLLGIDIADLVKTGKVRGVKVEKDDLLLDPETLLPPPHIAGRITEVHLEANNIVQLFGQPAQATVMRVPAVNYMAYRGSQLRFGKLTMRDTDMILIDMDPGDSFDFYLDHYQQQLTAGYTKITPSFGLRVFMRDYNKLQRSKPAAVGNKTAR